MNWSAVSAIAELIGAIAVVASLGYVAVQVRANTRQARLDAARDLTSRISNVSLAVASSREVGQLLIRGGGDYERLDAVDQVRFRGLMNALFRGMEQQFQLRREGALKEEEWAAVESLIRDFASLPGVQRYFAERGQWYTPDFLKVVWGSTPVEARPEPVSMRDQYRAGNAQEG